MSPRHLLCPSFNNDVETNSETIPTRESISTIIASTIMQDLTLLYVKPL